MSQDEPDPQGQDGEDELPPADPALQHLHARSFPDDEEAAATERQKLATWVEGELAPKWVYDPGPDRTWCYHWQEHPDAVFVLHALYRAWEELMDTEQSGMAAPFAWFRDHLRPALEYLRSSAGPFGDCMRSPHHPDHKLPEPIPPRPGG